jgi:transposase
MRFIGLDVHRDFCEVAIADEEGIRSAGRVETTPASLRLFAESLAPDDQVALEATGNALAIAAILRPHVGRVALANPAAVRGELNAPKTDKIDARSLARLLATGFLPEVWAPDPETAALRHQLARRRQLVKQRTREKNQIHAVLQRNLKGKPPASDLFGAKGRAWLAAQELPEHEREMVEACLRHIDFLDAEVAALDRRVAERVLDSPEMRRLSRGRRGEGYEPMMIELDSTSDHLLRWVGKSGRHGRRLSGKLCRPSQRFLGGRYPQPA